MIFIPNKLVPFIMPVVFAVLFVAGALLQVNSWNDHEHFRELLKEGKSADAVITGGRFSCIEGNCSFYHVNYEYAIDGKTYHTSDEHIYDYDAGDPLYNSGDHVSILYLPSDPSFSYIATNLTFPREKATYYGMVPYAALWGGMISLFWKPYRKYHPTSLLHNAVFHFRHLVTNVAVLVFVQVAAIAHEKHEAFRIHALWFFPLMIVFAIPWIEIAHLGQHDDSHDTQKQIASVKNILLEIAFPCFLGAFAAFLTFSTSLRTNDLALAVYLGASCIIALIMVQFWHVYKPLWDDLQRFIGRANSGGQE